MSTPITPSHRLLAATVFLAAFGVLVTVSQHISGALLFTLDPNQSWWKQWSSISPAALGYAAVHLAGAIGSFAIGFRCMAWCYPQRGLWRMSASNPAAALQSIAHVLAAAILSAASWGGCDAQSLVVSAAFWGIGLVMVIAISTLHRIVTRFQDHIEVVNGNLAVAIASAGLHVAIALIVGAAIVGTFAGWKQSLGGFAVALLWVLALYPLRQIVLARVILRMNPRMLDHAMAHDRDAWLGASEALCYLTVAWLAVLA